jgi:hypothetical protein
MSDVCFVLSPLDLAQSGADLNARLPGWNIYGKFGTMCGGIWRDLQSFLARKGISPSCPVVKKTKDLCKVVLGNRYTGQIDLSRLHMFTLSKVGGGVYLLGNSIRP